MKYFVKIRRAIIIVGLAFFLVISCTDNFGSRNTDPMGLESDDLKIQDIQSLFSTALYTGWDLSWQVTQNLASDDWCQFYGSTQPIFSTHRYDINQSWMARLWKNTYSGTMSPLYTIIENTKDQPAMNAIAHMWKVYALVRLTDYFGPIPYSEIGMYKQGEGVSYDSQEDVYNGLLQELQEAIKKLKNNLSGLSFGDSDHIYHGDNTKWLKLGNSLRLRLALRISRVEPEKAKKEAEAAVAGGVLEDAKNDAYIELVGGHANRRSTISYNKEFSMSANMASLLLGWNDPRLSKFFSRSVNDKQWRGVRPGLSPEEQQEGYNTSDYTSTLSKRLSIGNQKTEPLEVMFAAEAYFHRAEGALNGWNMDGTAKGLYNKGIEMSMHTWRVTDQTVINKYINGTSVPIAPDPEQGWNTPPLTNIPVKFSSDKKEIQREQVATQMWLALFPNSMEAWAEMRRVGYPRMYPLIHSDNVDVSRFEMLNRVPFTDIERQTNEKAVEKAVKLLGPGGDKASTRLWWQGEKGERIVKLCPQCEGS